MKQHFLRNLLADIGLCVLAMQSREVLAQDAPSWILDYTKVVVDKTDGAGEGG